MSYYLKVLKDSPIGFWQLDDVAVNPQFDFNDILENFDTYQDLLEGFQEYQHINYQALDSSGCQNTGIYFGDFENPINHFPLSPGGQHSLEINSSRNIIFPIINSYYKENVNNNFATNNGWDKEFSLECWVDLEINTDSLTNIFGDPDNSVGIFYQNKNIIFKLNSETLEYTLPFTNKVIHVVCVYAINSASIYIDGTLVISKNINSNPFENIEIELKTGPTVHISDTFIIDDIALYPYALSESQIKNHYNNESYTMPVQIVSPDNGEIFEFQDTEISKVFTYSYPTNKSWEELKADDIFYNKTENYIGLNATEALEEKEVFIYDIISIPAGISMDSSRIEWFGDSGVSIKTSIDGINYEECKNGESLPQYTYSNFNEARLFYVEIRLYSADTSRYLPALYNLTFNFYNQQIMYSKNGTSYISKIENKDFYLGSKKYPILSKDYRNGIFLPAGCGFNINVSELKHSIEFFYTPYNFGEGKIISSIVDGDGAASNFSWILGSVISKTNIDSIYVNGVDVSSETLINNIFTLNNLHHVVINFTEPVYGAISINSTGYASSSALYQYLTLYTEPLNYNKIINHYSLYSSRNYYRTQPVHIAMSENSVNLYNNDWVVVQNS